LLNKSTFLKEKLEKTEKKGASRFDYSPAAARQGAGIIRIMTAAGYSNSSKASLGAPHIGQISGGSGAVISYLQIPQRHFFIYRLESKISSGIITRYFQLIKELIQ
jgi:hypothetical protein